MRENVFLIGFMGSGKSTIARLLADELKMNMVEMDERIVQEQGMSINDIFASRGEDYFRDVESALVLALNEEGGNVVSCGGGVVVRAANVDAMKQKGRIVFLSATPETIYHRVKNSTDRPILNGNMNVGYIAELMEKRRSLYESAADITIVTDGKGKEEICKEIVAAL